MKIDDLVGQKSEWLKGSGPDSNIAISTRVRLARNLKGHIYCNRATSEQKENTLNTVMLSVQKNKGFKDALFLRMKDISELDRAFLVERHLISRELMDEANYKGLVVDKAEMVSAMINEEDHLRLQVLQSGFNISKAWHIIDAIDTDLSELMVFDYSTRFGYLTSCPTNTGTGLRASVMLHLSALVLTGQIENVFDGIAKLGLTMRGFYGEGTEALGDFFQISNQVGLGHSEMDILSNLEGVLKKIIGREKSTRQDLMSRKKKEMEERIIRSYETLKGTGIITSSETIKLLSNIRLGIDLGVINDVDIVNINEVMLLTQPAHLQRASRDMDASERDLKRADLIREKLRVKE